MPAPPAGWTHPPYAGHRDATHVWGRGTLDDKGSLVGICVAVVLIRGLASRQTRALGSFWRDLVRCNLYILLPASLILALAFVAIGMVQSRPAAGTTGFRSVR